MKLEFGADPTSIDILAMFSGENEKVSLGKNLKARGNVEEWLTAVEKRMKESLHMFMKAGLIDYDTKPRFAFLLFWFIIMAKYLSNKFSETSGLLTILGKS